MARNSSYGRYSRRRLIAGSAMAGAAALAGCIGTDDPDGGDDGDDGNDGTDGDDGNGDVEMADQIDGWGWDVAAQSLQLTAAEYEDDNGATVDIEEFGREDMKDQLRTNLTSGSGAPPVVMLESVDAQSFIDTNGILGLSDWIEEDDVRDGFVEGKWEALTMDGEIYALPWDIGPTGVFYRRSVYEEHGLDADSIETWDDFIAEGEKLPDDVDMLNLPENDLQGVWRYQFRQLGGQPFTEDGAVNIHSEESLQVARQIKEVSDAGIAANLEGWSQGWFSAYGNGDIASLPSAAWMEGTLRAELPDTAGDWGVYKIPAFEEGGARASNWGGSNLAIPSQVDESEAARAWDYMKFTLATDEMQLLMYEENGIFPALETTYDADIYDEELDFYDGQAARALFAEVAEEIPGYRFTPDTPEVDEAINTELQRMINGEKSPEDAVNDAAETVAENTGRDLA